MRALVIFMCSFVLTLTRGVTDVRASDEDRLRDILAIIRQRHDQYNPIYVKYRTQTTSTIYRFAALHNIDPEDRLAMARFREARVVATAEHAMKGAKVFDQWEAPLISSDGIIVKPSQTTVYIFDGKLLVSHNGGKSYAVSSSNTSVRRQDPLSEFNGEGMLLGLDDAFKTKQFKSIKVVISEQVGQVKNAKLHITLTNELKPDLLDVWLSAAEQGYCVLRLEQRGSNGNLFYEVSDCVYALIDGVYCPKAATWKNFYHKGTVHALSESRKYTADSIVLRGNQIPDSLFDTTIPRGSTLIDRDMNNLVINDPEEVERHIREAARSVERRSFYARFHWWYFAVAALLLVAGVLLFIHVLKVRQRHL